MRRRVGWARDAASRCGDVATPREGERGAPPNTNGQAGDRAEALITDAKRSRSCRLVRSPLAGLAVRIVSPIPINRPFGRGPF